MRAWLSVLLALTLAGCHPTAPQGAPNGITDGAPVVVLGDSISAYNASGEVPWPSRIWTDTGFDNRAAGGLSLYQTLYTNPDYWYRQGPDDAVWYIMLGTNDPTGDQETPGWYRSNMVQAVQLAFDAGATWVYLVASPYTTYALTVDAEKYKDQALDDKAVCSLMERTSCIVQHLGGWGLSSLSWDGVHPSAEGQMRIEAAVAAGR